MCCGPCRDGERGGDLGKRNERGGKERTGCRSRAGIRRHRPGVGAYLTAVVMGRAEQLITSFDAAPGDDLVIALDIRGAYRGGKPFWNASTARASEIASAG